MQIDLPDIGHRFEGLIQAMSEAIAETDEALMEKFFEGEPFTTEEIVQGMAAGVRSGQITPVFCGSAVNNQALDMLLYNMNVLLPGADTASAVGEANGEPVEITACKRWSGDSSKERPDSVTVTLYDGKTAYETVRLSDKNDWSYTWEDLDADGNWQVVETNITKGYVPSYRVSGGVVTITNTRSLIQTGQLNWPIWVLCGAGLALVALGGAMLVKKKKNA